MDEEIAAHLAKVRVLRAASISDSKNTATDRSNAMNSYLKGEQGKTKFNSDAAPFVPQRLETLKQQSKNMVSDQVTRPKSDRLTQAAHFQPPAIQHHPFASSAHDDQMQHGVILRQNEITTLLVQQQQCSSLPKRDIQVFDGDPLQFHTFMRAFENGVESKSNSYSDCLYFLEQFTRGRPRDLVRSCQHMDPD